MSMTKKDSNVLQAYLDSVLKPLSIHATLKDSFISALSALSILSSKDLKTLIEFRDSKFFPVFEKHFSYSRQIALEYILNLPSGGEQERLNMKAKMGGLHAIIMLPELAKKELDSREKKRKTKVTK